MPSSRVKIYCAGPLFNAAERQEMTAIADLLVEHGYDVYLPHATEVRLWRVSPHPAELPVQEPPIPGDPVTHLPQYPPANGYGAPGDVSAAVVFAG